ncbi:glycosyltransferase [Altererythrobacter indicus]|uniref:Glycosyltransferase n=1 Tax=Altericroceibacterium indicum TaxID=374177 RepID=A0A845AB95_9SPHN|nr:glycosyltransferase family 4 protein [Altericroceibacterium indicum]MXP26065.1 glycosyltransferase [Altericroceibacterium indicum]
MSMLKDSSPMKMKRQSILFCMRYPDDQGFVWRTVSRLRDMVAGNLGEFDCYIAFPELTGRSVHQFEHLKPIELDGYTLAARDKEKLSHFAQEQKLAAIVYMSAMPSTLDMAFLKSLKVATITTENDSFDHTQRNSLVKKAAKFILRRILHRQIHDLHIANAVKQGEWLASFAQIPKDRIVVAPNGIDCTRFIPAGDTSAPRLDPALRWVICVSQARPEKRVDMIIRTAARIMKQEQFSDVAFAYVGDGAMAPAWKQLAADLHISDRFHFVGQQQDLLPYYQAATLMVHAAKRESFGLVLAEAMACELPVVACAAAGPMEIIDNGVTGTLVGLNDEDGFQAAVEFYLQEPTIAMQHGKAGRERAEQRFSIHRQARDIANAIRQVVNKDRD